MRHNLLFVAVLGIAFWVFAGSADANLLTNGGSLSYPFTGTIDDVRIYSRALSEAEIQALASMGDLSQNLSGY